MTALQAQPLSSPSSLFGGVSRPWWRALMWGVAGLMWMLSSLTTVLFEWLNRDMPPGLFTWRNTLAGVNDRLPLIADRLPLLLMVMTSLAAWALLGRLLYERGRMSVGVMCLWAGAWSLPQFMAPAADADAWAYIELGRIVQSGHDPYTVPLHSDLSAATAPLTHYWEGTLTPYSAPVLRVFGLLTNPQHTLLTDLALMRFVACLGLFLGALAIWWALRRRHASESQMVTFSLLTVLNPVVLRYAVTGAHIDAWAMGWCGLLIALLMVAGTRPQTVSVPLLCVAACVLIAGAVVTKQSLVLMGLCLVAWLIMHLPLRRALLWSVLSGGLTIALAAGMNALAGWDWQMHGFAWLENLSAPGSTQMAPRVMLADLPNALHVPGGGMISLLCALGAVLAMTWASVTVGRRSDQPWLVGVILTLGLSLLLVGAPYTWYLLPVAAPLAAAARSQRAATLLTWMWVALMLRHAVYHYRLFPVALDYYPLAVPQALILWAAVLVSSALATGVLLAFWHWRTSRSLS